MKSKKYRLSAIVFYFIIIALALGLPNMAFALVTLSSFSAQRLNQSAHLTWSTESEIENSGFNLYRSESVDGEYTKINDILIPSEGSPTQGASYEFTDTNVNVQNTKTYYYKIEDIDNNGISTFHGPNSVTFFVTIQHNLFYVL